MEDKQTIILAQASLKPHKVRAEGSTKETIANYYVARFVGYECWAGQDREVLDRLVRKGLRITDREQIMNVDPRNPVHTLLIYYNHDSKTFWADHVLPGKKDNRKDLRRGLAWTDQPVYFHQFTMDYVDSRQAPVPHALVETFDGYTVTVELEDFQFTL